MSREKGSLLFSPVKVFAVYEETQSELARLWVQSWKNQGWTPQIVSPHEAEQHRIQRIVNRRGGGPVVTFNAINFSHRRGKLRKVRYGARGWKSAPVVIFPPGTTEQQVLNCGRNIDQ